jgi:hypothetical protein
MNNNKLIIYLQLVAAVELVARQLALSSLLRVRTVHVDMAAPNKTAT